MRPEALDALANQTMRPQALKAAATKMPDEKRVPDEKHSQSIQKSPITPAKLSTPFGERTDGTESAAKLVEEVVHNVKVAVDGALAWAEKKANELGSEQDSTGPYTSLATCVPSDLDAIANGILPAMPTQEQREEDDERGYKEGHETDKNENVAEPKL